MQPSLDTVRAMSTSVPVLGRPRPRVVELTPDSALAVFRIHGGVAHANDLIDRLRMRCSQPMSRLARWIAGREIIGLEFQGEVWLPLFQFDLDSGGVRPEAAQVIVTLTPAFDGRELLLWFVEPNTWLDGDVPVHLILRDPAICFRRRVPTASSCWVELGDGRLDKPARRLVIPCRCSTCPSRGAPAAILRTSHSWRRTQPALSRVLPAFFECAGVHPSSANTPAVAGSACRACSRRRSSRSSA